MPESDAVEEEAVKSFRVKYSEESCPLCGSRIDEQGRCSCGAGGA